MRTMVRPRRLPSAPVFMVCSSRMRRSRTGRTTPMHWRKIHRFVRIGFGGDFKVTLKGADFPLCCAYLIDLFAWKRTTNGCTDPMWVHNNRYQVSFTVQRVD